MRTGVIALKVGMSAMFTEDGSRIAVTLLKLSDCQVVGKRNCEKHGYCAVVVGAIDAKEKKVSKAMRGVFLNAKVPLKSRLKEFRLHCNKKLEVGAALHADYFVVGQYVDISGITVGKGFAGTMKRHNFKGLEASHGVSISHRSQGSTGQNQDPSKVFKNKKMAGRMGGVKATVQNLAIVKIDCENDVIVVSGAVPGSKGAIVYIRDSVKKLYSV